MKNKKSLIYGIFVMVILSIGVSYAYFSGGVESENTKFKIGSKDLSIVLTDDTSLSNEEIIPGWTATKTFTVKNNSEQVYNYNIILSDLINTFETDGYLQYKITSTNGFNMSEYKDVPKRSTEEDVVVGYDIDIEAGEVQEYKVEFIYRNDENKDQSIDMGKVFSGSVNIIEGSVDPSVFYTIKLTGSNVSIEGENTKEANKRGSVEFEVNASIGYSIKDVECIKGTEGIVEGSIVKVINIIKDDECEVKTEVAKYEVGIEVRNGSSNELNRIVEHGSDAEFTISADTGYTIEGAEVSDNCSIEGNIVSISNVVSEQICKVTLKKEKYNVYLSGEEITTTSPIKVSYKEAGIFNVTTSEGYTINEIITCDDEKVTKEIEGSSITIGNVRKETRCEIGTSINTYVVNVEVNGGTSTEESIVVNHGGSGIFNINANENHDINEATVSGGSASPSSISVSHGGSGTSTISASSGYNLSGATVSGTGCSLSSDKKTLTASNVTSTRTCTVTLKAEEYTITVISNSYSSDGDMQVNLKDNSNSYYGTSVSNGVKVDQKFTYTALCYFDSSVETLTMSCSGSATFGENFNRSPYQVSIKNIKSNVNCRCVVSLK